ncbi:MAG: glutamate 5-kinase [Chlamydiota bacterium]|nr:glutamate 5-kinase [Chlamydiota bacterium]
MLKRIVIKFGTTSLTNHTRELSRPNMLEFVRQIAELHSEGHQIIVVSSGAVTAGIEILKNPKIAKDLPAKQMFSSIGQGRLIQLWTELFSFYQINVGQILLTRGDLSDRQRYLNVRDTITTLIDHRVIPVINENDTVATEEIRVGDNDNLSALVANTVAADLLILLTDQKGLYNDDPRKNPNAQLVEHVTRIDPSIFNLARGGSEVGTGGMITKVEAAQIAMQSGTQTVIAAFDEKNILMRIVKGEKIGTQFKPEMSPRESRKRWLLSEQPRGKIQVDEGAEVQLKLKGASLLPIGIACTSDVFSRGSIVKVVNASDHLVAVGVTSYSSDEIIKIKGCHSQSIKERLGYSYGNVVIHRDNMVINKEIEP